MSNTFLPILKTRPDQEYGNETNIYRAGLKKDWIDVNISVERGNVKHGLVGDEEKT